jgi:thiol-disulfide isomerase/thioredoxin
MSTGVRTAVTVLLAALIGAAAGITAVVWLQTPPDDPPPRPDFTLPVLDGGERNIGEWDGKVVVLNFWATWCAPCRREIPLFSQLHTAYQDQGVRFLGVAIDDPEPIRGFLDQVPMAYPTFYGMESALDVAAAYGNQRGTLPYTVIIDQNGRIVERFSGELHEPDLRPILDDLTG